MAVPIKVGTEDKKKVYLLAVLSVVAVLVFLFNSGDSTKPASTTTALRPTPVSSPVNRAPITRAVVRPNDRALREFRPTLKPKKPEDRPDPTTIDPMLRLDLLAKVQTVSVEGSHRNIFEFGQAPPPKLEAVNTGPKTKVPSPLIPTPAETAAEQAAAVPAPPQAPPVPLKFYGYVSNSREVNKRAFFVEGEDIHVVIEGDVVKGRYRIVRIGVNSVVVEDTQFKSQQTLPLEEQPG